MAWKQTTTRILGDSTNRTGSISKNMLFIWCMLASVILYMVPQNSSNQLQLAFAHIFRVPLNAGRDFSLAAGTKKNTKDIVSKKEYEALVNEKIILEQQLRQQIEDFRFLTDLNSYVGQNVKYILGFIVPTAADQQNSELTIECSGIRGLEKGQFVMARNFTIIGTISTISTEMLKAKVKLITDPDSNIPVRIEGLKQDLWMKGNGNNTAIIRNVSAEENIVTGQKIYAIRHAGFTDSDRYLGTVSKRVPDDNNRLLWEITVKPAWNIKDLKEVAVIVKKQGN